ncbi:MAG TPA: SLC13 family permease [Planctomycetaceae bacterium]|nr:SLC13 family permease [Planctomycetaceae bacterium]
MDPASQTVLILLVGVVVVIGGVLALRLHAFLALILGALVVAGLTPAERIEQTAVRESAATLVDAGRFSGFVHPVTDEPLTLDGDEVVLRVPRGQTLLPEMAAVVLPQDLELADLADTRDRPVLEVTRLAKAVGSDDRRENVALARVRRANHAEAVEPGALAIPPDKLKSARDLASRRTIADRVADGFGKTCGQIGILIAMASIIGKCLLDSGAADRIVRSSLRLLGERRAPVAFVGSGFLLGIPVFFDTVFYLMVPLGKAMRMRTGRNYLLYVLTIVAGATMAHSLVPPTPGPLFVAEQLNVRLGTMILAGCVVGLFTATVGYAYAQVANRLWSLELRESPDLSIRDLEEIAARDESDLPPTWLSLVPILLPVVLIGGYTILETSVATRTGWMRAAATIGDKNIALVLSAAIAMATLVWQKRTHLSELARSVQSALAGAGVIILITAAGGAFGTVLQQTGVAGLIGELSATEPTIVVALAFLITAAVRTAQGSATVAMITAVGILGGLAGQLSFHPVYLALAIGCGSKPIAWMNDSGFWVITKMSGMTEVEGLKYVTPMTALMGVAGLGAVMIGVKLFPLV